MALMRTSATLSGLFVMMLLLASAETASRNGNLPDDPRQQVPVDVVKSWWSTLDATWNARDAQRFSDLFAENSSFRSTDRRISLEGRKAILEFFTKQFASQAANLRHRTDVRDIRSISSAIAAVDAVVEVTQTKESGEAAVLRTFYVFAIMGKSADEYKIHVLRVVPVPNAAEALVGESAR
jgi:uncharacterized protein (TIGR02246 family)